MPLRLLTDLLFPPRCPGCDRFQRGFCPACRQQIEPASPPLLPGLDLVEAAGLYHGPLRQAIHGLKFQGHLACARELAALLSCPPGLLVPVPSGPWRHHQRGFNPSELLVRALDRPWKALLSCPDGPQQKRLELAQRRQLRTVQARSRVSGPVVLVDDVLTTGSTLISCALALREAGASPVRAVVVAYQTRRNVHKQVAFSQSGQG
ncbi:MAG: amidophosphoribosyltransferase [Candidatus Xenobia bacterium]